MIIRKCTLCDLEEIYNIEKLSFPDHLKKETLKKGLETKEAYYYGLFEEALIAFLCYEKVLDEGQIISVAVHPEKRKKGYGRMLFNEVIKNARAEGINVFTLEVRQDNEAAIKLYKALDFKEVGVRRRYYENPVCDALLMDLELKGD